MKLNLQKISGIIIVLMFISGFFITNNLGDLTNSKNESYLQNELTFNIKFSGTYENITIDNLPGSWNNWEWAENQVWCSGSGTLENPYIIQDHILGIDGNSDGIKISNSHDIYFIIQNCTFFWDGFLMTGSETSIKLVNVTNGNVNENLIHGMSYGFDLSQCEDTIISNNTIYNTQVAIYIFQSEIIEAINNTAYSSGNGIFLSQSEHIIIQNNTVYSNTNGIVLSNSDFNEMYENNANNNNDNGILLEYSENNTIMDNNLNNNIENGIELNHGHNNSIIGNRADNNDNAGLYLTLSEDNRLSNNFGSDNNDGIYLETDCDNYIITKNNFSYNLIGIDLYYSDLNKIIDNIANNNNYDGIELEESNNNTIMGNILKNNIVFGTNIESNSNNNSIFENFFLEGNGKHGFDDGTDNKWDSTIIGNYWENHTSPDTIAPYGIVDNPYTDIDGSVGSIDYLPIAEDDNPTIDIISPELGDKFGAIAPSFNVIITEEYLSEIWYTIDGGLHNFTSTENGIINQYAWKGAAEGNVTIIFYAKDKPGNIGTAGLDIIKDSTTPIIVIISPSEGDIFGDMAPNFNISIIEDNLDTIWYSFDEGLTNFTIISNGTLNQVAWTNLAQENITIRFFARDLAGNEGSESVTVIKSILDDGDGNGDDNGNEQGIPSYQIILLISILSIVFIIHKTKKYLKKNQI